MSIAALIVGSSLQEFPAKAKNQPAITSTNDFLSASEGTGKKLVSSALPFNDFKNFYTIAFMPHEIIMRSQECVIKLFTTRLLIVSQFPIL